MWAARSNRWFEIPVKWKAALDEGQKLSLQPMIIGVTATGMTQVGEGLKDERGFKASDVVMKIEIDLAKLFGQVGHGSP
jgi:hypothetical protein